MNKEKNTAAYYWMIQRDQPIVCCKAKTMEEAKHKLAPHNTEAFDPFITRHKSLPNDSGKPIFIP